MTATPEQLRWIVTACAPVILSLLFLELAAGCGRAAGTRFGLLLGNRPVVVLRLNQPERRLV